MLRTIGIGTESFMPLFLVDLVIPFAPDNGTVRFKGQNMCRNPNQKPAIMANDNGTAAEVGQTFFKSSQRINVQIVGGFVEQHQVSTGSQQLCQMNAVSFASGKLAHKLLLI